MSWSQPLGLFHPTCPSVRWAQVHTSHLFRGHSSASCPTSDPSANPDLPLGACPEPATPHGSPRLPTTQASATSSWVTAAAPLGPRPAPLHASHQSGQSDGAKPPRHWTTQAPAPSHPRGTKPRSLKTPQNTHRISPPHHTQL